MEPSLWQILGQQGKNSGVIGVPVTYPLKPIKGFMIPGLLTPVNAEKQSYPGDLIDEIRKIVPDYKFSPKEWTRGYEPVEWVKELINDVKNKAQVSTYLMKKKAWDFMMVHFMESDQVQHFMWDKMEDDSDWNPVLEVYQEIDRAIGKIHEEMDEDDNLIIMSDHGFGPLRYNFHIDTWLLKEGYIKLKNNLSTWLKKLLFNMGFTKESLYPIGEYIYPYLRKINFIQTVLDLASNPWLERLFISSQNVNWEKSLAYSHSEIGHIYLNIKGREPKGAVDPIDVPKIRDELIVKLSKLKNPFTGKTISSNIYKGEEIYHGTMTGESPDIVFIPDDMEILGKGAYEFLANKVVSKSNSQSGHHRMDGILFATGPDIEKGKEISGAHIMDIAPTVLYLLGLPVMEHMDGKVLDDIFNEDYLSENEKSYTNKEELGIVMEKEENEDENDEEMRKRLKGLGYVS